MLIGLIRNIEIGTRAKGTLWVRKDDLLPAESRRLRMASDFLFLRSLLFGAGKFVIFKKKVDRAALLRSCFDAATVLSDITLSLRGAQRRGNPIKNPARMIYGC